MHAITRPRSRVSIRAVVFDFGNVLCLEQSSKDMADMARVWRCDSIPQRFCTWMIVARILRPRPGSEFIAFYLIPSIGQRKESEVVLISPSRRAAADVVPFCGANR
jgi:hypothetical protein